MVIDDTYTLLPKIIDLIIAAGDAVMKVYNAPFEVEYKEDNSPLTLADKLSHEIIATSLKKWSAAPVLSEEMKEVSYSERKNWDKFWLVDPLDGTKEFVKRNGEFTVNIAYIDNTVPVIGLIYIPVQRTLYYAVKTKGAYRIKNPSGYAGRSTEEIFALSEKLPLPMSRDNYTIIASRSHNSAETDLFISKEKEKHGMVDIVSAGSSIKFCLVAEGKADAYPRFAPTMEWDTAAGQVIAEEAGKRVTLNDGKTPLSYNKESLVNPHFIVIS